MYVDDFDDFCVHLIIQIINSLSFFYLQFCEYPLVMLAQFVWKFSYSLRQDAKLHITLPYDRRSLIMELMCYS